MVKSSVRFGYVDRTLSLKGKKEIQKFIADIVYRELGIPCALQYVFCSDEYLHSLNVSFLKHDNYTDIITFDLSDNIKVVVQGEIYISVDRVKENAIQHETGFEMEMLRVIFHGALHLCGYTDKRSTSKRQMREKEDEYLNLYFTL